MNIKMCYKEDFISKVILRTLVVLTYTTCSIFFWACTDTEWSITCLEKQVFLYCPQHSATWKAAVKKVNQVQQHIVSSHNLYSHMHYFFSLLLSLNHICHCVHWIFDVGHGTKFTQLLFSVFSYTKVERSLMLTCVFNVTHFNNGWLFTWACWYW